MVSLCKMICMQLFKQLMKSGKKIHLEIGVTESIGTRVNEMVNIYKEIVIANTGMVQLTRV